MTLFTLWRPPDIVIARRRGTASHPGFRANARATYGKSQKSALPQIGAGRCSCWAAGALFKTALGGVYMGKIVVTRVIVVALAAAGICIRLQLDPFASLAQESPLPSNPP
jgi:hypothetical protein